MIVKTRSASVALNDFPRIESNFVYTNLGRKISIDYGIIFVKYATQWQESTQ